MNLLAAVLCLAPIPASIEPPAPTSTPAPAQTQAASQLEDISALLEQIRAKHEMVSLGGAIVKGGRVVAVGAAGVRARGREPKVKTTDVWHLGSCTKAMTATLCGVLVDEGVLKWETTLAEAFPQVQMDAGWKAVTLRQLLTNTSGFPSDLSRDGLWGRLWRMQDDPRAARRALLEGVLKHPPRFEPGSKYEYSNGGFAIAGHMAETIEGVPYEELMSVKLFKPLGITTAGWGAPGTVVGSPDQPWGHTPQGAKPPGPDSDNPCAISPAGRAYMTLEDWGKFVALHLRGDRENPSREVKLLKPETFDVVHTPVLNEYAMGWGRPRRGWADGPVLSHSGSNTMWFCVVWAAPKKDFAVLIATNSADKKSQAGTDAAAGALIKHVTAQ